jgi:hypothetical protein
MSTIATTVINDTLSRMRDPNATMLSTVQPPTTASGRAFALTLLNHAQIVVNLAERMLIGTSDLALAAGTSVLDLIQLGLSDYGGMIVGCFVSGGNEIDGPVDFKALGRASRTWLTDINNILTQPISWAPIGNTLIAFYPTQTGPPVISIRYVLAPNFLIAEGGPIALPDYSTGHLARLIALIASIKTQQLTDFQSRLEAVAKDLGAFDLLMETGKKAL